jgi:hypothetical protein
MAVGCQNRPVPTLSPSALAVDQARNAGYDIVLLAHVLSALVGFGAVVVAGAFALVLSRFGPGSEAVRRYYRPGVNWAGRVLFLVPILGVVLVLMSHGQWSFSDGWIMGGLGLWALAAVGAEMALWPAERQLQQAVSEAAPAESVRPRCRAVTLMAALGFVILVTGSVIMVAKP